MKSKKATVHTKVRTRKSQLRLRDPRIRTVKPELFNHEGLFDAEIEERLPLRVAFIGLFTCCDREGRFRWQPRRLKLYTLPYDDIDILRVLDALVTRGFIVKYACNGKNYGCIPSWLRHQNINPKEPQSELPAPEHFIAPSGENSVAVNVENTNINNEMTTPVSSVNDACITREQHVNDACVTREQRVSDTCQREVKGSEEQGREHNHTRCASPGSHRASSLGNAIQTIFDCWKTTMGHSEAKLDHNRRALITKALNFGYDIEQLCQAIKGCSYTSYNMGDNDRGQRYDGLHVILRDADQIDRFIHHYHSPPKPIREADRRTQANVQTLQRWIDQKMGEEQNRAH
jgi:hypothetical protein